MEDNTPPNLLKRLLSYIFAAGFFIFIGYVGKSGCEMNAAVTAAGDAYVQALRDDRLDDAYGMLASDLRARVSRPQFEHNLATPKLRKSTSHGWNGVSSSSAGKGCLNGGVTVDKDGESLTLYMWREGERWTVYAIYYDEWDYSNQPWNC